MAFGVAPGYLAYKAYLRGLYVPLAGLSIDLGILLAAFFPVCRPIAWPGSMSARLPTPLPVFPLLWQACLWVSRLFVFPRLGFPRALSSLLLFCFAASAHGLHHHLLQTPIRPLFKSTFHYSG